MNQSNYIVHAIILFSFALHSCKTIETGGKVVDRSRNEVVISVPGNSATAMPSMKNDKSFLKARDQLQKSVNDNPGDIKSLINLAQIELAQENIVEAEATARRILLIDTKNQSARKILAQVAIRRENHNMALIFLTALGGEQSKDSDVLNMLGLVSLARGENDDAMRLWKQALTFNPGDISVRMNMGIMYLKNRLLSQAQTHFERILKIAPNHQDARLHLAIMDTTRGKNAEALEVFHSIISEDKNNGLVLFNMAVAQKNLALYEDSIESLKKYIKVSPDKSNLTDQAFAMIEQIQTLQSADQRVSDDEVRALATDLASRNSRSKSVSSSPIRDDEANSTHIQTVKNPPKNVDRPGQVAMKSKAEVDAAAQEKLKEPTSSDSEIEELEKQLKNPAH